MGRVVYAFAAALFNQHEHVSQGEAHVALTADPTWSGRVIPTFRPDRYLEPAQPGWRDAVAQLGLRCQVQLQPQRGVHRLAVLLAGGLAGHGGGGDGGCQYTRPQPESGH